MTKLYGVYGTLIILSFIYASYERYAFSSLFAGTQATRSSSGARTHSYHK